MKLGTIAALAAAGVAAALAASAWAQSLSPPQGSYRQSCTDIRASYQGGGRLLEARCRTSNGGSDRTSLRYENCRGDIANDNGRLSCSSGGSGGGSSQLPRGSYSSSCNQAYMSGYTLVATCRTTSGGYNRSSLDTRNCRGDIANDNGRLVCGTSGGGGGGAPIPQGSYRSSCNNPSMAGSTLTANCRTTSGGYNRSSIDTRNCQGRDIANVNGRLTCSGGGGGGGMVPNGSFRSSCSNAWMQGSTLTADCRTSNGSYNRSSIDTRTCNGRDIANINGRLSCSGGSGGSGQVPNGSYQSSCSNAYMTGSTLTATCRTTRGGTNRSSIDVRTCNGRDIANANGYLRCNNSGGGGGNASITLCTQPNYGGRCATIDRAASGLGQWEIANKAESARVRGTWQVCDQQDFRGRCTVIDRDFSDLGRIGFNKRISSVRPR